MFATNPTKVWFNVESFGEGYKLVVIGDTDTVKIPVTRLQLLDISKKIKEAV